MPIFLRVVHMRTCLGKLKTSNAPGSGQALTKMQEVITSCKIINVPLQHRALGWVAETDIEAMSFIPIHFRTSCTIILSFPFSPVSSESATEIGGPSSTVSEVTCCLVVIIGIS